MQHQQAENMHSSWARGVQAGFWGNFFLERDVQPRAVESLFLERDLNPWGGGTWGCGHWWGQLGLILEIFSKLNDSLIPSRIQRAPNQEGGMQILLGAPSVDLGPLSILRTPNPHPGMEHTGMLRWDKEEHFTSHSKADPAHSQRESLRDSLPKCGVGAPPALPALPKGLSRTWSSSPTERSQG